jgi:hypothetical protein
MATSCLIFFLPKNSKAADCVVPKPSSIVWSYRQLLCASNVINVLTFTINRKISVQISLRDQNFFLNFLGHYPTTNLLPHCCCRLMGYDSWQVFCRVDRQGFLHFQNICTVCRGVVFRAGTLPAGALPAKTSRFCSLIAQASLSNTASVRPSSIIIFSIAQDAQQEDQQA